MQQEKTAGTVAAAVSVAKCLQTPEFWDWFIPPASSIGQILRPETILD